QPLDDALDLLDVLVADALAAAVAALEAVEDMVPHGGRRLQAARPLAAPLQLPLEAPDVGEALGAQEAALPRLGVGVSPLDLEHRPALPSDAGGPETPRGPPAAASSSAARPASP